ncbi:hypothetical protein NQ318_016070 [Aromia moschata]|uniref:Uncharacterized protein n=1 Tax=Aromia moschata TaxID=1265417 RepID=A0AAV8XQW3_9CUCU|nr:hypothetical protein NQ318_016070 [Aromia moschata]
MKNLAFEASLGGEYIWCISLLLSFFGLDAIKKNRVVAMRNYMIGLTLFGFLPLLYAIIYYFPDVWTYLTFDDEEELEEIHMWQGYPYGLLWYAFIILALQVHSFSMYSAWKLITSWKAKGTKKIRLKHVHMMCHKLLV